MKRRECRHVRREIDDSELNLRLSDQVQAHIASCPSCREFRDGQRALWEALDQWEARPISADFDRRLYRKIEEQEQLGWWARVFGSYGGPLGLSSRPKHGQTAFPHFPAQARC